MSDAIIRKLADAIAANRKTDAPKESRTVDAAALKALEATIILRLAHMSEEHQSRQQRDRYPSYQQRRCGSRSGGKTDLRCLAH